MRKIMLAIKNNLFIFLVLFFSLLVAGVLTIVAGKPITFSSPSQTPTPHIQIITLSYKGEKGKDALTLLKTQTSIVQDNSGLVTTISGRKAEDKKHEYWAFYKCP